MFRAKRPDRIKLVFWEERVCVCSPRGLRMGYSLAEDRGRCDASVAGAIVGGLCMRYGRRRRRRSPDSCWQRCGEVNQGRRARRKVSVAREWRPA